MRRQLRQRFAALAENRRAEGLVEIDGVQLAAVAMRDSDDPDTFFARLAGTNHVISQYLAAELSAMASTPLERLLAQWIATCWIAAHAT